VQGGITFSGSLRGHTESISGAVDYRMSLLTFNFAVMRLPGQRPSQELKCLTVGNFCALIPSFSHLKWMFEWFIRHTAFDFPTLQMYGAFSKIKY
jgi:hypothetical protein